MISENNKKFLRKISFLENFTDEELHDFFEILDGPILLTEGQQLIPDDVVDHSLYIVLTGQFAIYKQQNKKKIQVATANKTEILCEMSEYVSSKRAVTIVVSTFDARVLKVDIKKYPLSMRVKIRENYCNILAQRLINRNDEYNALKKDMANIILNSQEESNKTEQLLKDEIAKLKEQLKEKTEAFNNLTTTV